MKKLAALLALWTVTAFALTAADKAALQSQVNALQSAVNALAIDVPAPPPIASWPRTTPDVLDIDLVDQDSILKAKLLDGSPGITLNGVPGFAIHYGDMSGPLPINNGIADYSGKLSNPSCPPKWGVEPNGLHYLESCTDGTGQVFNGSTCPTCRLYFWNFHYLHPAPEYYFRYMVWVDPITYANDTELGIKQPGLAGDQLEFGPKNATGFEFQTYRYGFESGAGFGVVEKFGFTIQTGRWYTIEQHDRINTVTNGVYNKDGLIEVKVDGVLVWVRNNVQQVGPGQVPLISSLLVQSYHGGLHPPKGVLRQRIARIAVCKSWCGPSIEVSP